LDVGADCPGRIGGVDHAARHSKVKDRSDNRAEIL
jgi:hypothetical protein